jgi:hypothetical protein
MTYTFKLSRRIARLRAPVLATLLLALGACAGEDTLAPAEGTDPRLPAAAPAATLGSSFSGGIPFGTFSQPNDAFGRRFNGGHRIIYPQYLDRDLGEIRARGGRIVLMLAGPAVYFKDANGHFSLTKWKARVDLYKDTKLNTFINDGTIIAHYMVDEPNDPTNWNGQPISGETLDEMARYSKSRYPNLPTIVRTYPTYLEQWGPYRYLDGAWAQYVARKGDPDTFLAENVASAKRQGLSLVVGLNLQKGTIGQTELSPSQLKAWGSALLGSSYPCAFISWHYDARYLTSGSMGDALDYLRGLAESHGTKSCAASAAGSTPPPPQDPPPSPTPTPPSVDHPLPFGLYQSPLAEYGGSWTGTMYRADPSELVQRLAGARSEGMKVVASLTTSARSRNADGTFSFTKWKAQVDRYRSLSLDRYISDKTMYAHHLVDQPRCASCWGGRVISWEAIEEMARYSKTVWPGLATTVRAAPTALSDAGFRWTYLDAGWAQYTTRRGDPRDFVTTEAAAAKDEGLGLIVGVSLLEASGAGSAPMSPSQITQIGTVLAKNASVCALIGLKYDATYLGKSGIRQALDSVARVARSRTATSCAGN